MHRAPFISLALGAILLVAMAVGVVFLTFDNQRNVAREMRLFDASLKLTQLFSELKDLEVGQRGYLLTQRSGYLQPYEAALDEIPLHIEELARVVAEDADQRADFARLRDLIPEKLAEVRQTIDVARSSGVAAAIDIVNSDRGRVVMEEIRDTIHRMRERQVAWLTEVGEEVSRSNTVLRYGVIAMSLGVLFLGVFTFAQKRRQRLSLEAHNRDIEAHSLELELANRRLTEEMETRQAAETQIRQMQKIEAIGQLTGGIAHDFNNMLAVVISAMGLVRRRLAAGDHDIGKYLEGASEAAERAATLTRRLLAFARQQPLAPESVDANKLVSDMSELLRRTLGENVQLETVLAGGLWRINIDTSQLENSILNLAVNARDAMSDGGRITIETANVFLDERYAAENESVVSGQYVLVAVTDTGTGMSQEIIARAFDPFFTTKGVGKGTGLGLSQVYGFVKQSSGHIKIYSEVGQGTTVKVYLPRHFAQGARPVVQPAPRGEAPQGRAGELVLLVEDEERVRTLSADTLREIGYSVIAADSGKAALDLLQENPGVVLLFTDIVMPEMSGRALADAALKLKPGLKVLYTTGFTRNAVVHNGVLDPGVNFIAKPYTIEELAAKVRSVIDG